MVTELSGVQLGLKALKFFALEIRGIEFTAEAPALSRC